MSDLIDRVLQVEEKARATIAQAERAAALTAQQAREEGQRILAQGHDEAHHQAADVLQQHAEEFERIKSERIREESQKLPSADGVDPARMAQAVDFVVSVVIGEAPEGQPGGTAP